jgi:phi13 family phage major tail protein
MGMQRIGASNLTVAKILTDPVGGTPTYDTPYIFTKKLVSIGVQFQGNKVNDDADDQIVDSAIGYGDIQLAIQVTDLTADEQAMLLGRAISGGMYSRTPGTDEPPEWCVMWKSKKLNGHYKFYKVLKVKFMDPDESFETKRQSIVFQHPTINGSGIPRLSDGMDHRVLDQDSSTFDSALASAWFTSGDITPDTTPPTVSVVPADAATGVAVSANIVWTFSKAIQAALMTNANFKLIEADGTPVAGTLSIGTNDTVVTFNPASNLDASTVYIAIATENIKDLSGNPLAAASVTNFTTA